MSAPKRSRRCKVTPRTAVSLCAARAALVGAGPRVQRLGPEPLEGPEVAAVAAVAQGLGAAVQPHDKRQREALAAVAGLASRAAGKVRARAAQCAWTRHRRVAAAIRKALEGLGRAGTSGRRWLPG